MGLNHDILYADDDLDEMPVELVLVNNRAQFEKHIRVERDIAETNPPAE